MSEYPLYDVPYLVREHNDYYMSAARRRIRAQNQAVVDDYFVARDKGASAPKAREIVAEKYGIALMQVQNCLRWFYQEAVRRGKFSFLQKFPPREEHIVHF